MSEYQWNIFLSAVSINTTLFFNLITYRKKDKKILVGFGCLEE